MASLPQPQGNSLNPFIIDKFVKDFDILYGQFWTTVLLYHLDVQVYNHSNFSKGIVDITLVCYNVQAEQRQDPPELLFKRSGIRIFELDQVFCCFCTTNLILF